MDMKSANDEDDAKKREKNKYVTMEHAFWIENTYTQLANFVTPMYFNIAIYTKNHINFDTLGLTWYLSASINIFL